MSEMADVTTDITDLTDARHEEGEGHDILPESLSRDNSVEPEGDNKAPENVLKTSVDFACFPWNKQREKESGDHVQTVLPDIPRQHFNVVRTVDSLSDEYDVNHSQRGHALVINQERFSNSLRNQGYGDRDGSNVDGRNIKRALNKLGFEVTYYSNVTASFMRNACKKMAEKDHSDADCFACVILTHGEDGIVFGTDAAVEIKELTDYFKGDACLTLVGKPKLFFIQACRGSDTDPGVEVDVTDAKCCPDADAIKLPIYADFLFGYSTVPGYYSWRNGREGSWFIRALCENIQEHGNRLEIQKLLVRVNRDVAKKFESFNPGRASFHRKKQVSCAVSMLTKDLYFPSKTKLKY